MDGIDDPLGSVAIPKGRERGGGEGALEDRLISRQDAVGLGADELIGADLASDGSFGVFSDGDARDLEEGGFFLDAARIREDDFGMRHQMQKAEIVERIEQANLGHALEPLTEGAVLKVVSGAGVHGKQQGEVLLDLFESIEDARKDGGIVDIRGAVQRQQAIGPVGNTEFLEGTESLEFGLLFDECVDHDVSDQEHAIFGDAFTMQVFDARDFGAKEHGRDGIGDDAIDLFGHGAVVGAQAGFDVDHGDMKLGCNETARNGAVDITDHKHRIRFVLEDDRLKSDHDRGSLGSMAA